MFHIHNFHHLISNQSIYKLYLSRYYINRLLNAFIQNAFMIFIFCVCINYIDLIILYFVNCNIMLNENL